MKETAYNQTSDSNLAEICTNETQWINKILKYAAQHSDQVRIIRHPSDNYGVLLAELPKTWFKISPPRKRTLSEEQKAILSERLKNARKKST